MTSPTFPSVWRGRVGGLIWALFPVWLILAIVALTCLIYSVLDWTHVGSPW